MADKDNLFDQSTPEQFLEQVVGEGKKYSDVEALAKGAVHADEHIKKLEHELSELREDLQTREGLNEILTELRSSAGPGSSAEPNGDGEPAPEPAETPNKEDIDKMIKESVSESLTEAQRKQLATANKTKFSERAFEVWGDDAPKKLEETIAGLGMSMEQVQALAEASPEAAIRVVGLTQQTRDSTSPPRSTVNLPNTPTDKRDYSWWRKLRQEDPKSYHSKEMSMKRHQDAIDQGSSFYG